MKQCPIKTIIKWNNAQVRQYESYPFISTKTKHNEWYYYVFFSPEFLYWEYMNIWIYEYMNIWCYIIHPNSYITHGAVWLWETECCKFLNKLLLNSVSSGACSLVYILVLGHAIFRPSFFNSFNFWFLQLFSFSLKRDHMRRKC